MKLLTHCEIDCRTAVAPLVGAWIETCAARPKPRKCRVAPLVGAWIETVLSPVDPALSATCSAAVEQV